MLAEGSETLVAIVAPDDAENKAVTWMSDNIGIASVSDAGIVTGVKAGYYRYYYRRQLYS